MVVNHRQEGSGASDKPYESVRGDKIKMQEFSEALAKFEKNYPGFGTLLRNEFSAIHSELASLKLNTDKRATAIEDKVADVKNEIEDKVAPALKDIYEWLGIFKTAFLRYRPPAVAMMVRKQLDLARLSIAKAFRTLFREEMEGAFDSYNSTEEGVVWKKFKDDLKKLYDGLLGKSYPYTEYDGSVYTKRVQTESLFNILKRSLLLAVGRTGQYEDEVEYKEPSIIPLPSAEQFTADCHILGYYTQVELPHLEMPLEAEDWGNQDDIAVYERLRFFIPAFIWAYNELKCALVSEYNAVQKAEKQVESQKKVILESGAEPLPLPPVLPIKRPGDVCLFKFGTAEDARKSEFWSAYFAYLKSNEGGTDIRMGNMAYHHGAGRGGPSSSLYSGSVPMRRKRAASDVGEGHQSTRWRGPGSSNEHVPASPAQFSNQGLPAEVEAHIAKWRHLDLPENEETNLRNAISGMHNDNSNLVYHVTRYNALFNKTVAMYQCLTVLLDPKFLEITVFGNSIVRLVVNFFAHKKEVEDEVFREAVSAERIREIVGLHARAIKTEGKEYHYDPVEETEKLIKRLSSSAEYLENNDPVLEKEIDDYLCERGQFMQGYNSSDVTDLHVLMSWLNKFNPSAR